MKLRVGLSNDLAAVHLCVRLAFEGYIDRMGRRPSSMDRDFRPLVLAGDVYVCESDGRVIGAIAVASAGDHLEVGSVAVDPVAQRRGVGKRLMRLAEEVAVARGFRLLRLHTNAALPELVVYYERLGYRVVERKVDAGFDRIFLQKVLPTALTGSLRMSPEVAVLRVEPTALSAMRLIDASDAYMAALYPPESNHLEPIDALERPNVAFYGVFVAEDLVACGAVKIVDDDVRYGEIKRVFVEQRHRGRGFAKLLMFRLEEHARELGLASLRLETGAKQPEALALYERLGYRRRGSFGGYGDDPSSVYMEKELRADGPQRNG